jgi:hypothetical protein
MFKAPNEAPLRIDKPEVDVGLHELGNAGASRSREEIRKKYVELRDRRICEISYEDLRYVIVRYVIEYLLNA